MGNMTLETPARRGPGRPRDPKCHEAILEATRQLIVDTGYTHVTFEAVARLAGVSRMTVRKWWSHRAELVAEALFPDFSDLPAPDTGRFRSDLEVLIAEMVDRLTQPVLVRGMPALRAELNSHPELLSAIGSRYGDPSHDRWREVFGRARARGEIGPESDGVAAVLVVLGAIEALAQVRPRVVPVAQLGEYLSGLLLGGVIDLREETPR